MIPIKGQVKILSHKAVLPVDEIERTYLMATVNDHPAGIVELEIDKSNYVVWVHLAHVSPVFRTSNVFFEFMKHLIDLSKSKGANAISFVVNKKNEDVFNMYMNIGCVVTSFSESTYTVTYIVGADKGLGQK